MAGPSQNNDWERRVAERRRAAIESFPYPIVRAPGAEALATWERMRLAPGTPVVLGGEDEFARVAEWVQFAAKDGRTPDSIIAQAAAYVFPDDLRARLRREEVAFQEWLRSDPNLKATEELLSRGLSGEPRRGPWPATPPDDPGLTVKDEFTISGSSFSKRPYDEVFIATVPTQDWTEAFAYLAYGGWNSCPHSHEHVAAFRYWTARYELVLVGMSGDVLNLRAARLPKTRDEALALAREQYEFCSDIVDQGGTLDDLAAGLMANRWWYFWWD
jgi:hypothetical protein